MTMLRHAGAAARGVAALLLLMALFAGVPATLVATVGNPLPARWSLTDPLTDAAVLGLLSCVAWVFWLQLVACVAVEVIAELRLATGRSADWLMRVPGTFGGQQALARSLVQAVVAIGLTSSAVSTGTLWVSHADAAEITDAPPPDDSVGAVEHVPPAAHPAPRPVKHAAVTVEKGDSLWSIAEQHLGAGERWREIADLNAGRQMHDGSTFNDVRTIEPGWVLFIPGVAATREGATITVERGDTLWGIAEDEYGEGRDWPRIYTANDDRIEDPDWIYPGQQLVVPGMRSRQDHAERLVERHEPKPAHADRASKVGVATEVAPEAGVDPSPPPIEVEPSEPEALPETSTSAETSAKDAVWIPDGATLARALLSGGGFLAAGALSLYLARRRAQARDRRSGRAAPSVAPALRANHKALRAAGGASLAPAAFFDAALRDLAERAHRRGFALPEVIAARIDRESLELYLAAASINAPAPWVSADAGSTWRLSRTFEPSPVDRMSPYPAMVTLGTDSDGSTLFLDLEGAGVIQVLGDQSVGADLLRFVVAELAINPWTDTEGVSLVGVADDVVPLNQGRLFVDPTLDIDRLIKIARSSHENISAAGRDVLASRVGDWSNAWVPAITVASIDSADLDAVRKLADELVDELETTPGRSPAVLVALAPASLSARAVTLTTEASGRLHTPWGVVTANRMTADDAAALGDLFDDADRLDDEPIPLLDEHSGLTDAAGGLVNRLTAERSSHGDGRSVLPRPDHVYIDVAATTAEDLAALAPAVPSSEAATVLAADSTLDADLEEWFSEETPRPRLRVLGPVELRAVGETTKEVESRPAYFAELTAYLNCHPNGLTPGQFATDFGIQHNTLHTRLGQLRKWLSTKPGTDEWYLPTAQMVRGQKIYRLDGILSDDDLFRRLRARASARGPKGIDDLRTALDLVTGPPFDQQRLNGYGWLADTPHDHYLAAAVVDVAHIVATHALAVGEPTLAIFAAEKAILAAPSEDKPRLDLAAARRSMGEDATRGEVQHDVLEQTSDDRPPRSPSERTAAVLSRSRPAT